MKLTRRKIRQIILESVLLESRRTRDWIMTQPMPDQDPLLKAYNDGIKDIAQLSWIQKTRGSEPIPDVAADVIRFFDPQVQTIVKENGFQTDLNKINYPTVNELRRVISQVEAFIDSRKDKPAPAIKPIDDPNQVEKLAQVGPWTILLPKTVTGSTACDISGKDTSWCTTKTRGQNLFLTYVGREDGDVILFYVMDYSRTPDDPYEQQDEPFLKNNDSRISIGFVHGKPVLDGKHGSLSVDAANMGLTDDDLRSEKGLGQYYDQIMGIIKAEAVVIGSNHPAKESLKRACQDLLYLKSVIKDYDEGSKRDYIEQVMNSKYDKSPEVVKFTAYYTPDYLLRYIQTDFYRIGETMTRQSVKEVFNKVMTMSPKDIFKYPSNRYGLDKPKAPIIASLLRNKSHLMDDDLFNKCLEEYAYELYRYRDQRSINMALDLLIEDIRKSLTYIAPPHPLIQQKLDERDRKMLSEEGMKNAIKQASYQTRGYDNGGLEALSGTYFTSKDKELKENFFADNIEYRFNHFLSCVRYLLENGSSTRKYNEDGSFTRLIRPQMNQMDGLAMGMTISILDAVTRENHHTHKSNATITEMNRAPKLVIQEIENAIYENFPEFFQMSKSEFISFMRDGEHDVDSRFYDYAGNMSIKRFAFDLLNNSGNFANNDGRYQIKTSMFSNLFSAIAGSPHISERAANHFKKHIDDYYMHFLSNPVHCDDQYLIDLYNSRETEYNILPRYRADGTIENVRRPKPGVKNEAELEIISRVNYKKTWTLGREVFDDLGIVYEG